MHNFITQQAIAQQQSPTAEGHRPPTVKRNKISTITCAKDPSPHLAPQFAESHFAPQFAESHLRTSGSIARKRSTVEGVSAGFFKLTRSNEYSCKHRRRCRTIRDD